MFFAIKRKGISVLYTSKTETVAKKHHVYVSLCKLSLIYLKIFFIQ